MAFAFLVVAELDGAAGFYDDAYAVDLLFWVDFALNDSPRRMHIPSIDPRLEIYVIISCSWKFELQFIKSVEGSFRQIFP